MDIEDWRKEIEAIDEQLLELLNKRSNCAIEIGRIKRDRSLPIYSPDREAQVIEHVLSLNGGPLEPEAVRRLFERIIDESRRLERVTMIREGEATDRSRSANARGAPKKKSRDQ